ncbi:MAG TPA: DrmE family protein [Thermoanaerobaculia bacterium]|nr:DrmE family protein [Thermoanaerobaculia bacterium]
MESCGSGIWLIDEERQAIRSLCRECHHTLDVIAQGSPRARRLEALLVQQPAVSVIVRHDREREEILSAFGLAPDKVLTPDEVPEDGFDSGATIVGWLGRAPMIRLLHPPIADRLTLLLYPIELRWYRTLVGSLERGRQRRRPPMSRQAIFPAISWKPPGRPGPAISQAEPPAVQDLEAMDWCEVFSRRVTALRSATTTVDSGPKCDVCLVLFTDERFAFLSPHRRLAVVTALLERTSSTAEPEVEERTVAELRPGDVLLLPTSADRDVIRSAADRQLAEGDRDQATQWQKVLRQYVSEQGLTVEQLRDQLAATGCRRHAQTIGQWLRSEDLIAPQNAYRGDLEAIAAVTGFPDFKANLERCKAAIAKVRNAHFTARRRLAELILKRLGAEEAALGGLPKVRIEGDLALVRVELVDEKITQIPRSVANRLLEP